MQAFGTGGLPAFCKCHWVVTKRSLLFIIALAKPDGLAFTKVNGGPNLQRFLLKDWLDQFNFNHKG